MEQRKPTKAQIEKRIQNAVVFVPRDKETKSIYFNDKGLRLTTTKDTAVIETAYHRHVFESITSSGFSRPFLYTKRFIEIALDNDCKTDKGYSYTKLFDVLKEKDDKNEFNMATYYDWWLLIIFNNLYSISEDEMGSWLVYFKYMQSIVVNSIIIDEHKDDLTNKMFYDKFKETLDEFIKYVDERIIIPKKTDEELVKESVEALKKIEINNEYGKQND